MGTTNGAAVRTDQDRIAESRLELNEMTDAWARRHLLRRGTPESRAALETDDDLVRRIRLRLRADGPLVSPTPARD